MLASISRWIGFLVSLSLLRTVLYSVSRCFRTPSSLNTCVIPPRRSNSTICHSRSLNMVDWHSPTQLAHDAGVSVSCLLKPPSFTIIQRLSLTSSIFASGFICERLLSSTPAFACSSADPVGNVVFPSHSISHSFPASVNFDGPS